jgi:deoxyribodipyrimidine photo-lyase
VRDGLEGLDLADVDALLDRLDLDRSVPPVPLFTGGGRVAKKIFRAFLDDHMAGYDDLRNQPQTNAVSHMSKYLHFGQVSPVWLALEVDGAGAKPREDRDSFLEELLVRRELAMNFVHYAEDDYDRYGTLPEWARTTLAEHAGDEREYVYDEGELADAATHDPYWNAAMREMRHTGYMHNYMRMYWGKKILEWTASPEEGFEIALRLNNRYFLDGRDANSYTGVAWCFGLHDRAWTERLVFGKVRYMNAAGLERKCDPEAYVDKVDRLVEEVEAARR